MRTKIPQYKENMSPAERKRYILEVAKRSQYQYINNIKDPTTLNWIEQHFRMEEELVEREEEQEALAKEKELEELRAEVAELREEARQNYTISFKSEVDIK